MQSTTQKTNNTHNSNHTKTTKSSKKDKIAQKQNKQNPKSTTTSQQSRKNRFPKKLKNENSPKIFVGGIPPDTDKFELAQYFGQFGPIAQIDLPVNKRKKSIKGYAFITFDFPKSLKLALKKDSHILRNKSMYVTEALATSEASQKTKRKQNQKLFVRGIPAAATEKQVKAFFQSYGEVDMVLLPKNKSHKNKGIAYVVMEKKEDFELLLSYKSVKFGDNELYLEQAASPKELETLKRSGSESSSRRRSSTGNYPDTINSPPKKSIFKRLNSEMQPRPVLPEMAPIENNHDENISVVSSESSESHSFSSTSSSESHQSESEDLQFENPKNYVFNYPAQPTPLFYPRQPKKHVKNIQKCSGEDLYYSHGLVIRREPLPPRDPRDLKIRANGENVVASSNHEHVNYVCKLKGGRFDGQDITPPERDEHFGPANHFGRATNDPSNLVSDDGITRFGPNFARPIDEFFQHFDPTSDEMPTIEVKQTVTTKYAINNEGKIFTGTVKEVNVWGSHPHEDNLEQDESMLRSRQLRQQF